MSDPGGAPPCGNLFAGLPDAGPEEDFATLAERPGWRLERIVSTGQATPPGAWFDQAQAEWVVLLQGEAGLSFEGEDAVRRLGPGDHVLIPAHCRHRVEWTAPGRPTVWLALHFDAGE